MEYTKIKKKNTILEIKMIDRFPEASTINRKKIKIPPALKGSIYLQYIKSIKL